MTAGCISARTSKPDLRIQIWIWYEPRIRFRIPNSCEICNHSFFLPTFEKKFKSRTIFKYYDFFNNKYWSKKTRLRTRIRFICRDFGLRIRCRILNSCEICLSIFEIKKRCSIIFKYFKFFSNKCWERKLGISSLRWTQNTVADPDPWIRLQIQNICKISCNHQFFFLNTYWKNYRL